MKKLFISLISGYQKFSSVFRTTGIPFFAATTCKFYPTCSDYALLAVQNQGPAKGSVSALKRICRCHPWSQGGVDFPS